MRCDFGDTGVVAPIDTFQSLSGFLMRCDYRVLDTNAAETVAFQSLSGFLMRCDPASRGLCTCNSNGFNPYRVF